MRPAGRFCRLCGIVLPGTAGRNLGSRFRARCATIVVMVLRPLTDEDFPRLAEMVTEASVAQWWHQYDESVLRAEAEEENISGWAILDEGDLAGLIFLSEEIEDPDFRHVDVDLFLGAEFQGRGLGGAAIREVLRHAFEERGHHRAIIYTDTENHRGIRCYEKVGYRRVGVLRRADRRPNGELRDLLLMDLLAEELER
jgi:aminoglycoside 6'-N-acetyltransferase